MNMSNSVRKISMRISARYTTRCAGAAFILQQFQQRLRSTRNQTEFAIECAVTLAEFVLDLQPRIQPFQLGAFPENFRFVAELDTPNHLVLDQQRPANIAQQFTVFSVMSDPVAAGWRRAVRSCRKPRRCCFRNRPAPRSWPECRQLPASVLPRNHAV